ncbi:phage terminase small subunit P27 family [Lactobacillus kefiranofaciens]|nr:phage terminase small subunit P27 family [Lactobacillus kefiranofaciens]MDF4142324.1 phage terminase small subunit P27 family [Lactobacillus kefiranofaciens]
MSKVDLTSQNVPNQAPKWLGTYGKYLYPKLATYLNKSNKILRADEYLIQQYCSASGRWAFLFYKLIPLIVIINIIGRTSNFITIIIKNLSP